MWREEVLWKPHEKFRLCCVHRPPKTSEFRVPPHRFSFCWRDCVWSENAVYMQTVWPKVFGHPWSHTLLYSWSVHVHKVSCINKWLSQFGLVWMGTNTCSRFNTWWRRDWNQQLFNAHGFAVFKCPHTFGHIVYLTVLVFNILGPCWKEECSL